MVQRILAALEQGEAARAVFSAALELAQGFGAELLLVNVLSEDESECWRLLPRYDLAYAPILAEETMQRYRECWEEMKQRRLQMLESFYREALAVGTKVEIEQAAGAPGRVICELAKDRAADLIVVGRRGYTGWQEWMMGSVSSYVLHHAPCSMWVVQGTGVAPVPEAASGS